MIHHWECKRCTHQWMSSCFGEMMKKPEELEQYTRHLWSHLCHDCFEQLEAGEIKGLEIFDLFYHLRVRHEKMYGEKTRVVRSYRKDGLWHQVRYSGMCHEYRSKVYGPDGNTVIDPGNWDGGYTLEEKEMQQIIYEVEEAYEGVILSQRTPKRIELDQFQDSLPGCVLFGPQPRPEHFVGDPPGKQRFEVLFGLDPSTGEIVPPTIQLSKSGLPDHEDK